MKKNWNKHLFKAVLAAGAAVGLLAGMTACGNTGQKPTDTLVEQQDTLADQSEETDEYVDKLDRSDEGLVLVWNDEFDGDSLDTTKWDYQYGTGSEYGLDGWGNSELEYYTDRPENVRVEDGKLIITAIKEEKPYEGMPYTSGRIRTITNDNEELFSTTYGRVEARIKMPAGEGIWPAFWMLPVDDSLYGGWAASGEIDIMEARGRLPEKVGGTAHYGKVWPNNTYKGDDYIFPEGTDITDYHVYALEWEPGILRWYVDDECYYTMDKWFSQGKACATDYTWPAPYDVPFYILLNMAVGGTFDPEANLDNAEFPAQMEVDFVRVYHKEEGYQISDTDAVTVVDSRDKEGFEAYAASYTDGEFMVDREFATMNTEAIKNTDSGIVADSKDWQFAVGNFGGAATAAVDELEEGSFARIDITNGGNQTYAVQLIQHFPVIEGYSYQVSFDAKATEDRSFIVSPSGDGDNGWVKYGAFEASVGTEVESYSFVFKMNSTTDPTSRLEFNLGQATGSVWIGNVSVTLVNAEGGVDDDMKKTPIYGGNLIYNGTFDQGNKRLAFWHIEDMDVVIPDYVVLEDQTKDYSRMAELTATGEAPKIYQEGIQLIGGKDYFMRVDLAGEADTVVGITLTGSDGTVYLEETCAYTAGSGTQRFEFKFSMPEGADDEDAVYTITLPEGGSIKLDNIKMNKTN